MRGRGPLAGGPPPSPNGEVEVVTIPWRDDAVVVRADGRGGEREQVHQGCLWQVVEWVRDQPDRERLTVWLPERRAQPFCFDQHAIGELLLRGDRPRGSIGFS